MDNSTKLYSELMALVESNSAFYFSDQEGYRVFNYRLATYTDFLAPSALEARGIMFYIGDGSFTPILVCRPFKKFFNLYENPFTEAKAIDFSKISKAAVKEDGSIITSYLSLPGNSVKVKSKQSLSSDQTKMATLFLEEHEDLQKDVSAITKLYYTVIMELVSPANRIVIEYPETKLRVLAVRDNITGDLLDKSHSMLAKYTTLLDNWVEEISGAKLDAKALVDNIPSLEGIEGYVFTTSDGLMFKHKTDWYKTLHHLKDSVSCERHLMDAILEERVDDVKAMFSTDAFTMNRISEMEQRILPVFNNMITMVETFYSKNKGLSRKDFAILGQKELKDFFHLAMRKYLEEEPDYISYAKRFRKELFNITEDEPTDQGEN